jgi:hypothetical protein
MGQSSQSSTGQTASSSSGKPKTLEACVVKEETDYFLVPRRGAPVRVSSTSSTDLGSHVGHRVRAHGTETMASNMGAGASGQAGTSGTAAGTSAQAGEQPGATTGGAVGSSANPPSGTSGATAGTSGAGDLRSAATREITIDRVDMVSETCPSSWNPTYNPSGSKSKSKSESPSY